MLLGDPLFSKIRQNYFYIQVVIGNARIIFPIGPFLMRSISFEKFHENPNIRSA